ncbi:type II toxin-antitoxin system Phd/YefM family antitoxin [Protofrankia symbiont of Coriaria ruscifolia]|uniref:type II toxin-antitoxin system Phd/YefM family antitoxin n=1 Tax=Protofrankia symbiont of Coriaria ruscifolia TaxID=1306542 RepID=UPI001A942D40|nr:type II toxin-antitoxin system Phd/YefM family antitoxin [Protofrankia symbiont of Coriaria ruscifolia]
MDGRSRFMMILIMVAALPLAEAKSHLSELVGRVHEQYERVIVMVHGRPSAVLVAIEDLGSREGMVAILSDSATVRRLAESEAELARGEILTEDDLATVMEGNYPRM